MSSTASATESRRQSLSAFTKACILFLVAGLILIILLPSQQGSIRKARQSAAMQTCRGIGIALFSYSQDHGGKYPDGKSSTEVFQKLLDENYISDPTILYVEMPGKSKLTVGKTLKLENVCWDVTSGVDASSPDRLPIVFLTGYKISYIPDGPAVLLSKPPTQGWFDWLIGESEDGPVNLKGIAVTFKDNSAKFMVLEKAATGTSLVPHFISPDFKPDGKTYHQLTPDGPLP